jgi:hypothetical protein
MRGTWKPPPRCVTARTFIYPAHVITRSRTVHATSCRTLHSSPLKGLKTVRIEQPPPGSRYCAQCVAPPLTNRRDPARATPSTRRDARRTEGDT